MTTYRASFSPARFVIGFSFGFVALLAAMVLGMSPEIDAGTVGTILFLATVYSLHDWQKLEVDSV